MSNYLNNKNNMILIVILIGVLCFFGYLFNKDKINNKLDDVIGDNSSEESSNETMIQYFEMYIPNDGTLWNNIATNASQLSETGFTSVWMPPAYKGDGSKDAGYSAYDLYDLGEFNQKGTVRTKYGTKDEYLAAIDTLHNKGIKVYADIVLDHKSGADTTETVTATKVNGSNRKSTLGEALQITSWTVYNFPGRDGAYSNFTWNANCFDGVDWDQKTSTSAIYLFDGKSWDTGVSTENGNYDYLMGSDIDFDNESVVNELETWGKWYVEFANLDGFRLDAVKHITHDFYPKWLESVRNSTGKKLFSVGEYWSGDVNELNTYIKATNSSTTLFDVPLHFNFSNAAKANGSYNMSTIFSKSLTDSNQALSVTFVDNHDTQIGQSLESEVAAWFKPIAYCIILTRDGGTPCVYYSDYYGSTNEKIPSYKSQIDVLMNARKNYAYGTQTDYLDGTDIIGWIRQGDDKHVGSGLAAIVSDGEAGKLTMTVGNDHIGESWYDITGNQSAKVVIDGTGSGVFTVGEKSYSVWVPDGSNNKSVQVDVSDDMSDNPSISSGTANPISTPSITKSPVVTANAKTTTPIITPKTPSTNNSITIYYYSTAENVNIHYQLGSGDWTAVPGVEMQYDSNLKYHVYTVDLKTSDTLTCCFYNGTGWDNNSKKNYELKAGTYTIKDKTITQGKPK